MFQGGTQNIFVDPKQTIRNFIDWRLEIDRRHNNVTIYVSWFDKQGKTVCLYSDTHKMMNGDETALAILDMCLEDVFPLDGSDCFVESTYV